jgi:hypothetical protein
MGAQMTSSPSHDDEIVRANGAVNDAFGGSAL